MTIPKPITLLAALTLLFSACEFNVTHTDRQIDKEAAEQVVTRFFLILENKNYTAADTLISKDFYKVTPKQKLHEMFTLTQDKLGDIQDTNLIECHTRVVNGTDPSSEYVFYYDVRYQYYEGKVNISLSKDPDGKIRVVGYHISSEGFDDSK